MTIYFLNRGEDMCKMCGAILDEHEGCRGYCDICFDYVWEINQ